MRHHSQNQIEAKHRLVIPAPRTWKQEDRDQGQPWLHREFKANLVGMRPCLRQTSKQTIAENICVRSKNVHFYRISHSPFTLLFVTGNNFQCLIQLGCSCTLCRQAGPIGSFPNTQVAGAGAGLLCPAGGAQMFSSGTLKAAEVFHC